MAPEKASPSPQPRDGTTPVRAASLRAEFDSQDLMRGAREVLIHHAGQVYRLQHTRNDKLILVK